MDAENKTVVAKVLGSTFKVLESRSEEHGPVGPSFRMIADLWNAYVSNIPDRRIMPSDVAHMMNLLKVARAVHGNATNPDHYSDASGYESIAAVLAGVEPNAER